MQVLRSIGIQLAEMFEFFVDSQGSIAEKRSTLDHWPTVLHYQGEDALGFCWKPSVFKYVHVFRSLKVEKAEIFSLFGVFRGKSPKIDI